MKTWIEIIYNTYIMLGNNVVIISHLNKLELTKTINYLLLSLAQWCKFNERKVFYDSLKKL